MTLIQDCVNIKNFKLCVKKISSSCVWNIEFLMNLNRMLYLPVSLGEAIDKLTILHIKRERITDKRQFNVIKEYDILFEKLKDVVTKYQVLYESMKKINLLIWHQMDVLRDGTTSDEVYMKLCKECINSNDIRFRIKNKINLISNSELKEQKGYKVSRLVIYLNCDEEYEDLFIKPVRYFSYIFDEVIVQTTKDLNKIRCFFDYDNTIRYNVNLSNIEFKQSFVFNENKYVKQDIYDTLGVTDELLQVF